LSGEVILELDDGAKVTLRAGDTYVQNGTRHRWSNTGAVPAVIAVVLIGADRRNVS
jgi:quercetin dioxygenase-like cupin family protein